MRSLIVFLPVLLCIASCGGAPDYNPLDLKWAQYIAANPGGHKPGTPEAAAALKRAEAFEKAGFALYQTKRDLQAIKEYEQALRLYASGRLYFRYANSLSNLTDRLRDAVKAYGVARELGAILNGQVAYNMACVYSRLNDQNGTYELLKKAAAEGYGDFTHARQDGDLRKFWTVNDPEKTTKELEKIYIGKYLVSNIDSFVINAVKTGKTGNLNRALAAGGKVGIQFDEQITLFQEALTNRRPDVIRLFVEKIFNPEANSGKKSQPVFDAMASGYPDSALKLLKKGFPVDGFGEIWVHLSDNVSILQFAAELGYQDIVSFCLKKGEDPNKTPDKVGITAIARAAEKGRLEVVKLLLRHGADPDKQSYFGESAYFHAKKNPALLQVLKEYEQKTKTIDKEKETREKFLKLFGHKKIFTNKKTQQLAVAVSHYFIFSPSDDFVDVGLGVYKLYVAYVNHDGKQETAMDQTGTFRLTGGKITFHNRSSYYVMTKDLPISFISTNTIKLGEFVYSIIR